MRRRRPATRPSASAARTPNPTRYARETGQRLPRWRERLTAHEQSAGDDLFVHFSDVPRMVIYPNNEYNTPTGFYAYRLKRHKISDFATDRRYAVVFRVKPGAKILTQNTYTQSDYDRDVARTMQSYTGQVSPSVIVARAEKSARADSLMGHVWNLTRERSHGSDRTDNSKQVHRWTVLLHKTLGYDGAVDECDGIIHPDEECQAVFFNTRALEIVEIVETTGGRSDGKSGLFLPVGMKMVAPGKGQSFDGLKHPIYAVGADIRRSSFQKTMVDRSNFSHANMSGSTGSASEFFESNMFRAHLTASHFDRCRFNSCNMQSVKLQGATMRDCTFISSDLTGADMRRANLSLSSPVQATINEAKMNDARLDGCKMSYCRMNGVDASGAKMAKADLAFSSVKRANFSLAYMSGVSLLRASATLANFDGADLSESEMTGSICDRASFVGANMRGARLSACQLRECNFRSARLDGADLKDAIATSAVFDGALMMNANLAYSDLSFASFIGAHMMGANLSDVPALGADFNGADLRGANLSEAACNFTGAFYDEGTVMPSKTFDPGAAGMIYRP